MAQPQLEQFTKRGLAVALRVAPGTPVVPLPASNGVMIFNGSSGTEFDPIEREVDRPFFGGTPFAVGAKRAFIEGEVELYPPATPGAVTTSDADCGIVLLPAGMTVVKNAGAKTTRYNPISSGIPISDAYWWHAGLLKKVQAARHNITSLTLEVGNRFRANVRIQGDYEDVEEAALPTIVLPSTVPVVARANNTVTQVTVLPGGSPLNVWAKSLAVDFGNQIQQKEFTEHKETGITSRQPTFTLRLAKTDLDDFNPWAVRDAGTLLTTSLRLTQAANLYSELGVRGQIEQINEVDIDGDYGWELSGRCIPSSSGGDEFYIEFGDATP
ncbi:phage tail tube protein [Pseudoxanthomonas mexicana]|uniref:phage tail tube protein n=1 Tax=Pseudoxanthomonas mexicana TaxID=128785 RepID=UPI00398A7D28